MELLAPIEALEHLDKRSKVIVYSDSQYVVKGITTWIKDWKRYGWLNSRKKPVANRELWERLDAAASKHRARFKWVRGHDGDPGNERADFLARMALLQSVRSDSRAFDAAVRGFSRHGPFDPAPYLGDE